MSSFSRMLNRGRCFLIRLYSRNSASTSLRTAIHSTESAVLTICAVRSDSPVEKYDITRLRRLFALPTYSTRPSASLNW